MEIAGAPTADIATGGDALTVDGDAPLIKLVNQIIIDAFKMRASDIHLEPALRNSSGCGIALTV